MPTTPMTRQTVFTSMAKYALENHMPLDAAAVNASEILEHHGLTSPDDTMQTLMRDLVDAAKVLKKA